MIAYNFNPQFAAALESGGKQMTVRPLPQRYVPAVGEEIALLSGDRVIKRVRVRAVEKCVILIERDGGASISVAGMELDYELVARWDGFEDEIEMGQFLTQTYGMQPGAYGRDFIAVVWGSEVQL